MNIPITVTKEQAKKLKKLYKDTKTNVKFVEVCDKTLYIDYFGEIIPLSEALDRVFEIGKKLKK